MTDSELREYLRFMGYNAHQIEGRVMARRFAWMRGGMVDGEPIDRGAELRAQDRRTLQANDWTKA